MGFDIFIADAASSAAILLFSLAGQSRHAYWSECSACIVYIIICIYTQYILNKFHVVIENSSYYNGHQDTK